MELRYTCVETLNTIVSRSPRLKDMILVGTIKEKPSVLVKSLTLVCPSIKLLDIKDLKGVSNIDVKTETPTREVIVVKRNRSTQLSISN